MSLVQLKHLFTLVPDNVTGNTILAIEFIQFLDYF